MLHKQVKYQAIVLPENALHSWPVQYYNMEKTDDNDTLYP